MVLRMRGEPDEDRRYRAMRERNAPHFAVSSVYRVFLLQAVLAWLILMPVAAVLGYPGPPGLVAAAGVLLWIVGFVFVAGADLQLSRFRRNPENTGQVLDYGFWSLTRHPNYFGEFCIWWGFYLMALDAGYGWTVLSPLLLTVLLLRVSGVTLLEDGIDQRRPAYREYRQRVNAFFPGWSRHRRRP